MKIAIQGETGSFSHLVALQWNSESNHEIISCKSFSEVFKKLQSAACEVAIVPIENSLTGRIGPTTNLFIDENNVKVIAEEYLPVSHCLMSSHNVGIKNLKKIYGHPEALTQCVKYLSTLDVTLVSFYDGAAAINHIIDEQNSALIASKHMAKFFNLYMIAEDIQDVSWNQTRFFVVAKENFRVHNVKILYKTSIIFSTKHIPGALSKILQIFASNNINLTRLESIPSRKTQWEYNFLLDFEGSINEESIKKILAKLVDLTQFLKILGSYPSKSFQIEENILKLIQKM